MLLAGPAQTQDQPILVGLAFHADSANKLEQLTLQPSEWSEVLQFQSV